MRHRGSAWAALPYLAPALLVIALIVLLPLLSTIWLSLTTATRSGPGSFSGLAQYSRLAQDGQFWQAVWFTLVFSVLTVGAELVLGVSVAALLARQFAGRGVVRLLLLLPWAVPTVVAGKMWEWLFNYDAGLLNTVLARLAGEAARVDWLGSLPAAYISLGVADVWKTTPYVIFLSLAALIGLDPDIIAAARLDGASPRRIVLNIVLPMIAPALLVIAAFRMIDAFRVFDLIYVLTGGSPGGATTSVSLLAYQKLFVTGEYAYAAAVSTISFLLFLVLAVGYLRMYRQARSFRGGAL